MLPPFLRFSTTIFISIILTACSPDKDSQKQDTTASQVQKNTEKPLQTLSASEEEAQWQDTQHANNHQAEPLWEMENTNNSIAESFIAQVNVSLQKNNVTHTFDDIAINTEGEIPGFLFDLSSQMQLIAELNGEKTQIETLSIALPAHLNESDHQLLATTLSTFTGVSYNTLLNAQKEAIQKAQQSAEPMLNFKIKQVLFQLNKSDQQLTITARRAHDT